MHRQAFGLAVWCGVLGFGFCASAQSPLVSAKVVPAASNSAVGVVDIAQVFRQHAGFKQQTEAIQQEIVTFDREVSEQRKVIAQQNAKQKSVPVGSPEYRQLDEEIARRASRLQLTQDLKKKELRDREATLYFETYREVQREIARLADQYRLSLVLRFDGQPIDEHNPASVMAGINRPVLYQRNLDLTPFVVSAVNKSTAAARPTQK